LRGLGDNELGLALPESGRSYSNLRTLKAGSMDLKGAWGIAYLNELLSRASLHSLHIHNASSWERTGLEYNKQLMLRSGSLPLTKLELDQCALNASDMRVLLSATPSLKILLYSTGRGEGSSYSFTAAELVDMLDGLKDSLEELFVEIVPCWEDVLYTGDEDLIASLSHFTALKTLDTIPCMWQAMEHTEETDLRTRDTEQSLSERLRARSRSSFPTLHTSHILGWPDLHLNCPM
jgi:hypothetical protein